MEGEGGGRAGEGKGKTDERGKRGRKNNERRQAKTSEQETRSHFLERRVSVGNNGY